MIILFKITPRLLQEAGYRKMPSHVYSKRFTDEEWITQSKFVKNDFPRFHVQRVGKQWNIHYDYWKKGLQNHSSDAKGQIVRNERARLKKLSSGYV